MILNPKVFLITYIKRMNFGPVKKNLFTEKTNQALNIYYHTGL